MEPSKKVFFRNKVGDEIYEESQESDGTSATIEEAFIFKLGKPLGGRSEVVNSPVIELLKFMDMELDKEEAEAEYEKAKMYIQYLSNVFAQQTDGKNHKFEQGRNEFLKKITPNTTSKSEPKKEYSWDFDPQELLE